MKTDIKVELKGRWGSVLQSIGFPAESLSGRHGPCQFCGGKDRSRFDKNKETLFCSGCGHKSGIEIAMHWLNMSYGETAQYLRPNKETYKMTEIKAPDYTANADRIKKIHAGLRRLTGDCLASRYLAGRGITVAPEADCYFHASIACWNEGAKLGDYPAMVSVIRTPTGEVASYHLTYLSDDAKKADVQAPRKIMPVIQSMDGAAVRLFKASDCLCIAEGIESALAAHIESGMPAWAAVNAGMMEKIVAPVSVKHVAIYCDEDKSFRGAKAAYTLANRLKTAGHDVEVIRLIERKFLIDKGDSYDINDYVISQANA